MIRNGAIIYGSYPSESVLETKILGYSGANKIRRTAYKKIP